MMPAKGLIGAKHPLKLPQPIFYKAWSACSVTQPGCCDPLDWQPAIQRDLQARYLSPGDLSDPEIKHRSLAFTGRLSSAIKEVLRVKIRKIYPLKLWTEKSGRLQSRSKEFGPRQAT